MLTHVALYAAPVTIANRVYAVIYTAYALLIQPLASPSNYRR